MSSEKFEGGVTVDFDDGLWEMAVPLAADSRRTAPGLGGRPMPSSLGGAPTPSTLGVDPGAAAASGDLQWLLQQLETAPGTTRVELPDMLRRPGAELRSLDRVGSPTVNVELADEETAALLVECEGVFAWQWPDAVEHAAPATARGGTRAPAGGTTNRARFVVRTPGAATARGPAQRGVLTDWMIDRVKAVVLKFAARHTADAVVSHLERTKRTGPVVLSADPDARRWQQPETFAELALPQRPARLLLFVHGTFSSTVGAFGDLAPTRWGQALMSQAAGSYDALIGYDHRTLSVDPLFNAQGLYAALQTLPGSEPPMIDIICHSRGALVVRSLIEKILPQQAWRPRIGKVVFVGATNAGTELARPENWHALLDLMTNLALASRQALSLLGLPQAGVAAGELISGIGDFVRYVVDAAVEDKRAPGLAAMDPDGPFVRDLNRAEASDPQPTDAQYYVVVSDFRPRLVDAERHEPKEIPRRLALMLANGFIGALMKRARNDLVVNVDSMTAIDPIAGTFVKGNQDFGTNPLVYHTNYFMQPETVDAIAGWLGLPGVDQTAAVNASLMSSRIVVVDGQTLVKDALRQAIKGDADYVVFRRTDPSYPGLLHYAPSVTELRAQNADSPIGDALQVRESRRSPVLLNGPLLRAQAAGLGGLAGAGSDDLPAYSHRAVVMQGDQPVAVMPPAGSALDVLARASAPTPPRAYRGGLLGGAASGGAASGGATRSLESAEPPSAEASVPRVDPVSCNVQAEMPPTVVQGRQARVTVTVSAEEIEASAGQLTQRAPVKLARRPLTIEVVPRVGFKLLSTQPEDSRVVLDEPPAPGAPCVIDVDLTATDVGDGEVWAVVRQGAVRAVTLVLKPRIVASDTTAGATPLVATAAVAAGGEDLGPVATLEISQQRNGNETRFRYSVNVPGVAFNRYESPPITGDLAAWVQALYEDIEQAWLGSSRNVEIFHDNLKARGAALFRELVPPNLVTLLWQLRCEDRLDSVLVLSDEPFVPWEIAWLDDPQAGGHARGCFFGELGLCRWLYGAVPPARLRVRPGRMRYVLPHYPEPQYRLLAAEGTEEPMLQAMGATPVEPHYRQVTAALQSGEFDLLHFAGHGVADGAQITRAAVLLQGEHQTLAGKLCYVTEPLAAAVVAQKARLRGPDGNRPLVMLNACQVGKLGFSLTSLGGFAPAFLGARVGDNNGVGEAGVFISPLWSVGDEPASTFAHAFYAALQVDGGATVAVAVAAARQAARTAGDASWLAYAVYAHPLCHVEFTP